jgi:hypothetical protein
VSRRSPARCRRALVAVFVGAILLTWCAGAAEAKSPLPSAAQLEQLVEHRQEIVRKSLQLEPQQQAAFDPVFAAYEKERAALASERSGFVDEFSDAALAMSGSQADALIDRFIGLRRQRVDLDEKFRPQFEAVLSPQKTLLLFQLNFILDAVVNYDLAGMIPLAR